MHPLFLALSCFLLLVRASSAMKALSPVATALASAAVATVILTGSSSIAELSGGNMPFRQVRKKPRECIQSIYGANDTDSYPHACRVCLQYQTAGDIPAIAFDEKRSIYGRVEKIVDGDTFRIRHYPFYPLGLKSRFDGRLSDNTIAIRIYAVDCPEVAKFGNKAMPMADEATAFTRRLVDKKVVRVKLLRRDQYNRVVGKVFVKSWIPFRKTDLTLQLAERGYATLYTGGGAEYDDKRELIEKKIATAKKKKRGIWKNSGDFETPAEYKRRIKNGNTVIPARAF